MKLRTFPGTNLSVSEVGFGVWTVATSWWGDKSDEESIALLRRARDCGVTFFDTADTYGNGRGETLLRDAFGHDPEELVYATKFGYDIYSPQEDRPESLRGQRELPQKFDRDFIRFACEQSIQRLGVEAIDLWQIHNARFDSIQRDDLWATLEELRDEGKIRYFGVALGPANGWLHEGIGAIRHRPITSLQVINNMLEPHPGSDFYATAREKNVGLLIRVPHSSGMLEGKYTRDTQFPANDHRRHRPRSWLLNGIEKLKTLAFLTQGREQTLGQAAIKWLLADPLVCSVLPNIYESEQLDEFAAAPDLPDLSAEDLARISELQARNFGVEEEEARHKGEGEDVLVAWEEKLGAAV